MSTPIDQLFLAGNTIGGIIGQVLNAVPDSVIGGIPIQVTIEESMTDTLDITDHPVEEGASITDHAYKRPAECIMRCGWSNSGTQALIGAVESLFTGGSNVIGDYVSNIYSQLLSLQQSIQPISVQTSIRLYQNMLIKSLSLTRDRNTSQALMVTATLREVIIVSTQSASLTPQSDQATPASTAAVTNAGPQSVSAGTPSPGGAVDQSQWESLL